MSQKQAKYLVRTPGLQARAHRLLNLFPSNVIIKCTANSLYPGNPGRLFVENEGEGTSGAGERENKTRNQTVRRIAEEKQGNEGKRVRQVGGFPQEQLEM